jgi:DNA polymerase I-like protein with 3'-5' exonuclease and polymerase domains/uracil-DNA glycosylase
MTCDPRSLGAKCDECPLREISQPVPTEQNNGSQFVVVGDYPGENEEREGRPFVGPNGSMMQSTFGALGLKRRDANWTNVVLCRPPESDMNRFLEKLRKRNREIAKENIVRTSQHVPPLPLVPTPMECCAPRLWNEVMEFDKVLAVGGLATKVVFNSTISVMAVRGSPTELDRFGKTLKVVPTLHPSFVSKNMRWMHVMKNDILRAIKWWNGVADWSPPVIYYHPRAEDLRAFLADPSVPYWTYDVETDGIESLTANLRCVGIGTPEKVVIVGYDGIQGGRPFYQPHEQARVHEVLKEFFADPNRMKVGHNAGNYDRIVIEQHFGVTPAPLLDTIMLHRLVESELPHNLGFLGSMYTGAPSWKTDREGRKLAYGSETDHELHEYCLFEGTPVITEHGTEPIETLVRNKYTGNVLSRNLHTGELEWKPVTGWHYSVEKNVQWYKIEVEGQRERDRGLICTHDHKIIGPEGEVEAQSVQPGDFIYDAEPQLSDDEVSAVLGTLLGDSILTVSPVFRKKMHEARSAALSGGHAKTSGFAEYKQNELPWLKSTFIPGGQEVVIYGRKGVKDDFLRLDSPNMRQLAELMPLVYDQNGKRRLRVEALDRMGPRGWAWWFMDDGCVQKKGRAEQNTGERGGRLSADETLVIATQSFPREDIDAALEWFRTNFGSAASGKDNVIRLSTIASRTFAAAIAPYLPEIARYKLPKCRDVQFDTPYVPVQRYNRPSLRRVVSVGPHTPVFGGSPESQRTQAFKLQRRYCLDVADNRNFFTTYGLVHNCGLDVAVTAAVVPPLYEQVRLRDQMRLVSGDHRIQAVCAEMHRIGMYVDQSDRGVREKALVQEALSHREALCKLVEMPKLNPGSPHQLRELLFEKWKIEPPVDDELRYTLSGDPSTSDNVLRSCLSIPGLTELQLNAIRHIRYYRKAQKLLGTYVAKLRFNTDLAEAGWDEEEEYEEREARKQYGEEKKGIVDPRTGRMYPGYNAHVAVTGRLSSSKPINAQNFPSKLRSMVTAAPGHILVGADADQLELRIAASLWKSELYLAALEAGADPHASTALAVFGDKFRACNGFPGGEWKGDLFIPNGIGKWASDAKRLRDLAKRVQYASQYAASVETVHRVIAQTETNNEKPTEAYPWPTVLPYLDISVREVRMMHEKWVENAKFDGGWDMEMETYRTYGYLAEPIMGRRRDFLDGENLNEIVNFRIQSSGASLMNKALLQIHEQIPLHNWGPHTGIINQCHDSIVVECPLDGAVYVPEKKKWEAPKGSIPWRVKHIIEEAMNQTTPALPGVAITATAEIGMRWNEV